MLFLVHDVLTSSNVSLYWFPQFVVLRFSRILRNENGRDKQEERCNK